MRETKNVGLLAATALITAMLTGCGTQEVQQTGPPLAEPVRKNTSEPPTDGMPLDGYHLSAADEQTVAVAKLVAAAKCMKSLGFSSWTAGKIRTFAPDTFAEQDRLEALDPATAAASGYPRPTPPPLPRGFAFSEEPADRPTEEERGVFEGYRSTTASGRPVPAGGCIGQGGRDLNEGVEEPGVDARLLASNAADLALSDDRVRKAGRTRWRTCMKQAGHSYEAIVIAENDERWRDRPASTPAGTQEKAVAAADAECRQKSNLTGVYLALKKAHQERLLEKHRPALEQARAAALQRLENARNLLGTG